MIFAMLISMPRINSIDFYQNRPKIKLFLPKKLKFFESWGIRSTPYASGGWGPCPRPQLPLVVGGSAPRPPQRPPHCKFLVTGMLEEKFTARYCRHPFILAFDFKYAWNVWRRRYNTVYNTAKSISPGNTYTEKLSQKSFHLHQPHFGFGRDEVFFFLNIVRSSNKFYRTKQRNHFCAKLSSKKHGFVSENFGCHLPWNRTN